MKQLLLVFVGGGIGSAARYFVSKLLNNSQALPLGTMLVNVVGSFLIGAILGYAIKQPTQQNLVLLLATGFCGGFTTFSTFAYENQLLLKSGDYTSFLFYTFGSVIAGLIAVFLGILLVKYL